jgi:hypothetical protein
MDKIERERETQRISAFSRGRAITVTGSGHAASKVGAYMDAVGRFVNSNNPELAKPIIGQSVVDAAGNHHPFETDPNTLYRLTTAGEGTFEQVYRLVV